MSYVNTFFDTQGGLEMIGSLKAIAKATSKISKSLDEQKENNLNKIKNFSVQELSAFVNNNPEIARQIFEIVERGYLRDDAERAVLKHLTSENSATSNELSDEDEILLLDEFKKKYGDDVICRIVERFQKTKDMNIDDNTTWQSSVIFIVNERK